MRIAYHLGALFTDDDRLLRCLLKNRDLLAQHEIVVPGPNRYRRLLRETANKLKGQAATIDEQALILDQIMEEDRASRMILSWESFLSLPNYVLSERLYPAAGERVRAFCQIFPQIEAEFFLAIRNPASFLPLLYDRIKPESYRDFLNGCDPFDIYWSEVIERIVESNPGVPLTVWCDEDTPLIWPEVLQAVSGHDPATPLQDDDELLALLMTDAGLARYHAYCREHPPQSVAHRRRIVTAFLEKFGRPEQLTADASAPGWTEELVEDLTAAYLEDVGRIARIPGVHLIEP